MSKLLNILSFGRAGRGQSREATTTNTTSTGASVPARVVYASSGNALQVAAFYHAVDLRAGTFARAIPVIERYNQVTGTWDKDIKNLTFAQHYRHLQYLLSVRPNSRMTATQFWRRLSETRDMEGSSAIYMVRDGQDVYQLIPCCSVSYNTLDDTYNLTSWEYNNTWTNVDSKDVIILKGMCTIGRQLGEPLWRMASKDLTLQLTATDLITKVYGKGGTFRAIVKQEGGADPMADLTALNDTEVQKNTESIQEKWNKGDDFVYDPSAANITQVSQSFQDLQLNLIAFDKVTEEIARVTGVPLPLMFCSTNAVYKSIDDAWHTFLHLTIEPMWEQLCEEFNAKYFGEDNYGILRFAFDTTTICLDSENIKATTASTRRSAGITTANEERAYMGLPAIEGGDELNKQTPQPPEGGENKGASQSANEPNKPNGANEPNKKGGAK